MTAQIPSSQEIVRSYFDKNFHVVMWPDRGDLKGPTEPGWPTKPYNLADFTPEMRVGLVTGQEVAPGRFLHDVDIDWAPGYLIATQFLPKTEFIYGRHSKHISHCFYTLSEAIYVPPYKDPVDKSTLLEIRGTKENGELGLQSMVPPSMWEKSGQRERLEFRNFGDPAHFADAGHFKQRCTLAAIGMLLAKHFGHNGFGHEPRLAWAGYLLRANITEDDMVRMGEAISTHCNNREVFDVRRVVQSTWVALQNDAKKVKGGPALAKLIGGVAGRKIIEEINKWLGRDSDFIRDSGGMIVKDNQQNVRRAIRLLGYEVSYQEFGEKILVQDIENAGALQLMSDRILNKIWLRIDAEIRFRPTFAFYEKVINDLANDHTFHPVRDYLHGLSWDGKPRINNWLTLYGGAEEYEEVES